MAGNKRTNASNSVLDEIFSAIMKNENKNASTSTSPMTQDNAHNQCNDNMTPNGCGIQKFNDNEIVRILNDKSTSYLIAFKYNGMVYKLTEMMNFVLSNETDDRVVVKISNVNEGFHILSSECVPYQSNTLDNLVSMINNQVYENFVIDKIEKMGIRVQRKTNTNTNTNASSTCGAPCAEKSFFSVPSTSSTTAASTFMPTPASSSMANNGNDVFIKKFPSEGYEYNIRLSPPSHHNVIKTYDSNVKQHVISTSKKSSYDCEGEDEYEYGYECEFKDCSCDSEDGIDVNFSTPTQSVSASARSAPVQSAPMQSAPMQTTPMRSVPIPAQPFKSAPVHNDDDADTMFSQADIEFFEEYFKTCKCEPKNLSKKFRHLYDALMCGMKKITEENQQQTEVNQLQPIQEEEYVPPIVGYTMEGKIMRLRQDGIIDLDTSVPGWFFNDMYKNCRKTKLTNESCNHNGFQFKEGLNVDTNAFKHDMECGPDGLYFCREYDADNWLDYRESEMKYVWDVVIPDDARVVIYDKKIKADKFILRNKREIINVIISKIRRMIYTNVPYSEVLRTIEHFNDNVKYSSEMMKVIIEIMEIYPMAFEQLKDEYKTSVVCDIASKTIKNAYYHMPKNMESNEMIIMQCLSLNSQIFCDIPDEFKTSAICSMAFDADVYAYSFIPEAYRTIEMSKTYIYVTHDTYFIPQEHKNDQSIINKVIEINPSELKNIYYKNITSELCKLAISRDGSSMQYIPFALQDVITEEMALKAITIDSEIFWKINTDRFGSNFIIQAVKKGVNFNMIPRNIITKELLSELVVSRSNLIDEIDPYYLSDDLYIDAIKHHNYNYEDIDQRYMTVKLNNYIADVFPNSPQAITKRNDEIDFENDGFILQEL